KPLRWGILGPGRIAEKLCQAVSKSKTSTLQSVASRDLARAQNFAQKHSITHAFGSYEELLLDESIDVIYIATPHPFHAKWAIRCAEAGKHILCEKPVAMNMQETQAILQATEQHDVFFMEAFMYRCHPQTRQVVDWIQSGIIGQVRMVEAHFGFHCGSDTSSRLLSKELGGGGILDVGCYPMSFVRLIAGIHAGLPFQEPESIKAVGTLHPETEVDIWSSAVLQFPDDVTAQISCSMQAMLGNGARIIGSEGSITVGSPWFCNEPVMLETAAGKKLRKNFKSRQSLYSHQVDLVAQYLTDRQAPSPAMSRADTRGNMAALDRWRQEIGLHYPADMHIDALE
ncbi:MAG: Gfo/Idh/MocA family oxidoreductase, partial [Verrucomicrobiota bacterium]